jgi:hypothetical protein
MVALAALDSAAGGLVFDNKDKLPLRVAITVDGLCARSVATNSGGIVPSDTSRFYGTLDSLQTLDVPLVFGVNLDSAATYPRDLQYAKDAIAKARFTPQGRSGVDSTAAGNGNASNIQTRDAFRRYRNAAMAVGVAGGAAGDTSLYALLHYAILRGDSLWPGRSSRFALPVDDDWSPYNLRANQAGPTVDSVLYAYRKAGYKGIRINGSWAESRPNKTRNNPRGFTPEQGNYAIRYGTVEKGDGFKLLAHNGGGTFGSVSFGLGVTDSTAPAADQPQSYTWSSVRRFWDGLFGYWPILVGSDGENATGETQRCRILRMSAQELAGAGTDTWKSTQRPGWWAIKQVVMPIRIMNRLAGRSIMVVDYPENCQP